MSFHGVIAHFFLALNNIALSGCTTFFYLFIHLLKDILVASKFDSDEQSCYKYPCAVFCVFISFQLIWVNTKEQDSWIVR